MSSFLEWRPDFKLVPSWSAAFFVSILHVISLLVVIWIMASYESLAVVGLLFIVAVALSWLTSLISLGFFKESKLPEKVRRGAGFLYKKRQICSVTQEPSGEWRLYFVDGSSRLYMLSGASVVNRFAIFLSFKPIGVGRLRAPLLTRSLLVASDSVDAQTYRRLHVWLRWQRGEILGLVDFVDQQEGKG